MRIKQPHIYIQQKKIPSLLYAVYLSIILNSYEFRKKKIDAPWYLPIFTWKGHRSSSVRSLFASSALHTLRFWTVKNVHTFTAFITESSYNWRWHSTIINKSAATQPLTVSIILNAKFDTEKLPLHTATTFI